MRSGCGMFIVGAAAMVLGIGGGLEEMFLVATHRAPAETTCAAFIDAPPPTPWVVLTDCRLEIMASVIENQGSEGRILRAWIPVVPSGAANGAPVALVMQSDAEDLMAQLNDIFVVLEETGADSVATRQALHRIHNAPVHGLTTTAFTLADDVATDLNARTPGLGNGFVVLRHEEAPNPWIALLYLLTALGGAALVWAGVMALNSEDQVTLDRGT